MCNRKADVSFEISHGNQIRNKFILQDVVGKMESHLREQTRLSNAAQDKLIADEARFRSLKVNRQHYS